MSLVETKIKIIMKRFILTFVAMAGIIVAASAQKAELTLSYGGYTAMDAGGYKDGWGDVNNAWGALNAGVNFRIMPDLWVGPSYTFSSATTKGGADHSSIAYHAIMVNGRYNYYRTSIVTLYAHLGLGTEISHLMPKHGDSFNKTYFAYQISPVGAEVGFGRWAMFGELGFGVQGLLQVGAKMKF